MEMSRGYRMVNMVIQGSSKKSDEENKQDHELRNLLEQEIQVAYKINEEDEEELKEEEFSFNKEQRVKRALFFHGQEEQKPSETPKSGQKTYKRPKKCCMFCKKLVLNLARHLLSVHSAEEKVIKWNEESSEEGKKKAFAIICGEGAKCYNRYHPTSPLIMRKNIKRPSTGVEDLIECPSCQKLCGFHNFARHVSRCNSSLANVARQNSKTAKLLKMPQYSPVYMSTELQKILASMTNKEYIDTISHDKNIALHGQMLCEKYMARSQEKFIASILRTIARIFLVMIEEGGKDGKIIESTNDCFRPSSYLLFEKAIKKIAGIGGAPDGGYSKPSLVHQYGIIFRNFAQTVMFHHAVEEDEEKKKLEKNCTKWIALYNAHYANRMSIQARKQAYKRTIESRNEIPLMEDVKLLSNYIKAKIKEANEQLDKKFSFDAYETLCKALLLRIWVFNRKRVKEVDQIYLKNWNEAKQCEEGTAEFDTLSRSEKLYANSFKRIVVDGKLDRKVALLVSVSDVGSFERIINLRKIAGIAENNKYLFPTRNIKTEFIEGTKVMREWAESCGAQNPKLLRGTKLRKHLASSMQYLSLSDEDLKQVAETMGHTKETHLSIYRKQIDALHLGRVSKVLLALDEGDLKKYRGLTVDEMTEEPETTTTTEKHQSDSSATEYSSTSETELLQPERGGTPGRKRRFVQRKTLSEALKITINKVFQDSISRGRYPGIKMLREKRQLLVSDHPTEMAQVSPKKLGVYVQNEILKMKQKKNRRI